MAKFEIIRKRHDKDDIVTHVQLDLGDTKPIHEVEIVIALIEDGKYQFYTQYRHIKADVRVQKHSVSGKKFLISTADGIPGNNIDNLPPC